MSLPSIVSYGAGAKTSTLVWDSDLTIPDGFAIESASGEVGIVGDVSISGSVSAGGNIGVDGGITAGGGLVGADLVLSEKALLVGEIIANASVTLAQFPSDRRPGYTSPDFTISGANADVIYSVPAVSYKISDTFNGNYTFNVQAKVSGTYQTIASSIIDAHNVTSGSTQPGSLPKGATALRYTSSSGSSHVTGRITSPLSLSLTPIPVY